jgi:hypothetical protein
MQQNSGVLDMDVKLRNVVVIGGTGNFGARICRRLVNEPGIRLYIAGRSQAPIDQLVSELNRLAPHASVSGAVLDHRSDAFERDLEALQPSVVLQTAGPFQGQDYRVAKACVACKSHYVDLADGRSFVDGFQGALHAAAQEAEVLLVTGASTLPGLSSAVIQEVARGWQSIDKLDIAIAPARQTPRGLSTIGAVLSYCGKPFDVWLDGCWQRRYGWQCLKLQRYSGLGLRLSAVCDVPDLALFPQRMPTLSSMVFRAALESKLEHLALWFFAGLARLGVVRDWGRFAASFQSLNRWSQRLGGDVGGMRVEIEGRDRDGVLRRCQWNLVAGRNQGPEIPVSPALVLTRKLLRGELSLHGAHPCIELMSLEDFATEVAQLDIRWSTESTEIAS